MYGDRAQSESAYKDITPVDLASMSMAASRTAKIKDRILRSSESIKLEIELVSRSRERRVKPGNIHRTAKGHEHD